MSINPVWYPISCEILSTSCTSRHCFSIYILKIVHKVSTL
uniref:Uncharacterized protein n=1 Tax=Lepeophtheirus salmonis TaxID=72036 RepID=A0A0K2UNC2_LEPSM